MPSNQEFYGAMSAVEANIKQSELTRIKPEPSPQYGLQIAEVAMKSAFMLAGDYVQENNQNYQSLVKNTFDQKLGRDQTIGRLNEINSQYKFTGNYSQQGRALKAQVDNYINNYKTYEAAGVDRMVEHLGLDLAKQWVNSDHPKNVIDKEINKIKEDLGKNVTTGLSSDFLSGIDAYGKFNDTFGASLSALSQGMGDVRNTQTLAGNWVNLQTQEFLAANQVLTPENLHTHIANISAGLSKTINPNQPGQTKFLFDTIKDNASNLLVQYGSQETLDQFINLNDQTKSLFDVNEIYTIGKAIENRNAEDVIGTPAEREILGAARESHAVGRPIGIKNPEQVLKSYPVDARNEIFLQKYPIYVMSPEAIDNLAQKHPADFAANYDIVNSVKEQFKDDAADNTQLLFAKRKMILPENVAAASPNLPAIQYDPEVGVANLIEIDASFKKHLMLHKYAKEDVFVGATDIKSPISKSTKETYKTFFADPNKDITSKFRVADVMIKNIEAYNKSIGDPRNRIDPFDFISELTGTTSLGGTLARQAIIENNNRSMGLNTAIAYDSMGREVQNKTANKLIADSVRKQFDAEMAGTDMDSQTREAYKEIATAAAVSLNGGIKASDVKTMSVSDVAKHALKFVTVGNQKIALIKKTDGVSEFEGLSPEIKVQNTLAQNPIVVNGKQLTFADIKGNYRLRQKPLDVNSFFLEIAADKEQAKKGRYSQALNAANNPIVIKFGR